MRIVRASVIEKKLRELHPIRDNIRDIDNIVEDPEKLNKYAKYCHLEALYASRLLGLIAFRDLIYRPKRKSTWKTVWKMMRDLLNMSLK